MFSQTQQQDMLPQFFKNPLKLRILLLIIGIFFVNTLAIKFYWYSLVWWFDMPMHFLGGLWVGLAASFVWLYSGWITPPKNVLLGTILTLLISVFLIGFLWEVYEFAVQYMIPQGGVLANPLDSLSDIFFDCAGGVVALLYIMSRVHQNR